MTTKRTGIVMWEHYEVHGAYPRPPHFRPRPQTFLGYTFETRTVYHNKLGYFVRVNGHRRTARPVGRSKTPVRFKVLGSTSYRG